MTGFLDVGWPSRLIAIADIMSVKPAPKDKHGNEQFTASLRDGHDLTISGYSRNKLALHPVQLIPAPAGWSVIRTDGSVLEPSAYRDPLIAWALCLEGSIRPVTPEGVNDRVDDPIWLETPDGKIMAGDPYTEPYEFENAAAMVAHFAARKTHSGEDQ